MSRNVRGSLFVDYVRMLRGLKDVDLRKYLNDEDMSFLVQRIERGNWYPMATFERMGLAILGEITKGAIEPARMWGRVSIDGLWLLHPDMIVPNEVCESLMRFKVLRRSFFDYEALDIVEMYDEFASVKIDYGMSDRAEEAATWQTLGFFDRLLELCGAKDPDVTCPERRFSGNPRTLACLRWKR